MKKLFFPLLFLAINLHAQSIHTYQSPEAWRDEDMSVPHRFVKVTLLEAVNVVQHKAPYLLANNNVRKPVFLEKDRPVYFSLPAVIPIIRDTAVRVDTVERIVSWNMSGVNTVYVPGKTKTQIVYRDISLPGKPDTVYIRQTVTEIKKVDNPIYVWAFWSLAILCFGYALIMVVKGNPNK